MAERRMFAKTIVDSDAFMDMPLSSQALYFHLSMRADDDGFINNPRKILKMIGASDDDMKILIAKKYVLLFESGVIAIKHWKINNYIQKDRYKETVYIKEKSALKLKENGAYTLEKEPCIQNVYSLDTQYSIGKVSIGNNYIYSRDKGTEEAGLPEEMPKNTAEDTCKQAETVRTKDAVTLNETKREKEEMLIDKIIDYLNKMTNSKYSKKTVETRSKIRARLREGYTAHDFKNVIDKKCAQWIGTEFEQYLRPKTLFGNKFEDYLNAKQTSKRIMPVYSEMGPEPSEKEREEILNMLKKEFKEGNG